MSDKSLVITYLLWLTLGWFGVHHVYLRRDQHAFVWLWTLGGVFGVGWIMEIFRLPAYVRLTNSEKDAAKNENHALRRHARPKPKFSWKRFIGELIFSMYLGTLMLSAVPNEITAEYGIVRAISPLFIALGVYVVANIGNERCSFIVCLCGAYVVVPLFVYGDLSSMSTAVSYSSLVSSVIANWLGRDWKPIKPRPPHICCRLLVFVCASAVMGTMVMSSLYYNTSMTTQDGERILLRDAIHNVLTAPAWAEFRQTVHKLWQLLLNDGFDKFIHELSIVMDPEGEENAYRTLGLNSSSTNNEIKERYRHLAKQFHPDKVQTANEEERKQAEHQFIRIKQAYDLLLVIRGRRRGKSEL